MKIAFSTETNQDLTAQMSHHFGRCPYYVMLELNDDNTVNSVSSIENPYYNGHEPGIVPEFISKQGVNVMISGGMGQRAVDFFNDFNIKVATGARGTVENALKLFLDGTLNGYTPCTESIEHQH